MTFSLVTMLLPLSVSQPTFPSPTNVVSRPAASAMSVRAQAALPSGPAMTPMAPIAPLLAAKAIVPEGVRVILLPGSPASHVINGDRFAFRPGYIYRLELSNLPYRPGQTLYPEIEVRGSLVLKPGMKYMEYPIPLKFSEEDIERAVNGIALTKVIYLEDPEKAVPVSTRPDSPLELSSDSEAEALRSASENGRIVAIVRMGDRKPTDEELQARAVPGTVLLPGAQHLPAPAIPPIIPWWTVPLYDPVLGPRDAVEECVLDGGDRQMRMGIGPNARLGGLEPTDVGVEYTMAGQRRVTSSNTVCICSPRFVIQRAEVAAGKLRLATGPRVEHHVTGRTAVQARIGPLADVGREKPVAFAAPIKPMAYVEADGTQLFVASNRPNIIGQIDGLKITGAVVEPEQLTAYPNVCPLSVTKSVEPNDNPKPGDLLWITIRYANTGNRPISDVVLSDSLSGRLEYVAGSALSDRPANFSTLENEAGSTIVRWEFPLTLQPGQRGVVKFQVRVR